ncbi:MAG: methyltransferase, partial [Marinilabiliales bacterium]
MKNKALEKRYQKTLTFLKANLPTHSKILDLGTKNKFSEIMSRNDYLV